MIKIEVFDPQTWARDFSENAHLISFEKTKPAKWDRIDFALLAVADLNPLGYVTCREFDHETIYIQFGGSLPGTRGTGNTGEAFKAIIEHLATLYKRVTFLVENTNIPMLKLAMNAEFRIVGIRNFKGSILLEHGKEFQ